MEKDTEARNNKFFKIMKLKLTGTTILVTRERKFRKSKPVNGVMVFLKNTDII